MNGQVLDKTAPLVSDLTISAETRALHSELFSEIFVFASFGNRHFTKIRVGASFSSFFRTRLDSRKLVPTLIFAKIRVFSQKNREKTRFSAIFTIREFR